MWISGILEFYQYSEINIQDNTHFYDLDPDFDMPNKFRQDQSSNPIAQYQVIQSIIVCQEIFCADHGTEFVWHYLNEVIYFIVSVNCIKRHASS